MAKPTVHIPKIHIDLLHPQSNPEKLYLKITKWTLSTGRFMIIFVELIVLLAFISRFKFDEDLSNYKDSIDQQIPYIESLKADEILIRQTQSQLSTISQLKNSSYNLAPIFKTIADQTPQATKLSSINISNTEGKLTLKITGDANNNNELATLLVGLRSSQGFTGVSLSDISLQKTLINFTLTALIDPNSLKGTN